MKKLAVCIFVVALIVVCSCAFADEITAQEIERRALLVKSVVSGEPNSKGSLNMENPFLPIRMEASSLKGRDKAFFLELGIDEESIADVSRIGSDIVRLHDREGHEIKVIFSGYENDHAFVFEEDEKGEEYLIDIVYSSYGNGAAADLVELSSGRYLLINVYGHGSGSMSNWTSWYNLDTRKVDLYTVREAYESYYPAVAESITRTNVDHVLDCTDPYSAPEELITYTYTTVYTSFNENRDVIETVLHDDCTVRVYRSYEGGLALEGERIFESYSPAVMEQMSGEEILDSRWQLVWEEQEVTTSDAVNDVSDGMELIARLAKSLPTAKITNADWVNVRQTGSKESPSVATVNAGESVFVISEGNGFENGWTEVLVMKDGQEPVTGYIWWSFLEKEK